MTDYSIKNERCRRVRDTKSPRTLAGKTKFEPITLEQSLSRYRF